MKRLLFLISTAIFVAGTLKAQDMVIYYTNLPDVSQSFIEDNFDKTDVAVVKCRQGRHHPRDFKVYFDDGSKVKFTKHGNWEKVKMHEGSVPCEIVPMRIASYVSGNYPQQMITSISKKGRHYLVELSNGMELDFNGKGRLVKVD